MEGDNSNNSSASAGIGTGTGRLRFNIELRPGETTIVSWKKLIKEANTTSTTNNNKPDPPPPLPPPTVRQKAQEVQVALDEYFQDENPTTKNNEFTISKGIMEHLNEPLSSSDCQLIKRKKYIPKDLGEKVDDRVPNKHAKLGHARLKAAKNVPGVGQSSSHSLDDHAPDKGAKLGHARLKAAKNVPGVGQSSSHSQSLAASSGHYHDRKLQHSLDSPTGFSKKMHDDTSCKSEYSLHSGISNDASAAFVDSDDTVTQKLQCMNVGNNLKVASEFSGATHRNFVQKNEAKRTLTDTSGHEFSTNARKRLKNGSSGLPDLNIPASPIEPAISQKSATNLKDVPTLRPKGTTLERAIRDLEKVVAESRPPNLEVQEAETSSIAVKRRLPHEVKQKLAKVARLAQSSQGKISEELVNRLMSIIGHLVQLRTLKRNLREMVLLGLSAKQEKADRIQLIKKEVTEMIKLQASKLSDGAADDFQETFHSEENGFLKEKLCINSMLEDKICDLYDLYLQGMDEDKGPQIRKLYAELAELWPEGTMDNHGIKKAICRAKERRRTSYGDEKVQEKARAKKPPAPRMEVTVHGEVSSTVQPQAVSERMIIETNKMIPSATAFDHHLTASARMSILMQKSSKMDLPKQEKLERTAYPTVKEQKQEQYELESKVNKLSLRATKESHKSHKRANGKPDGLTNQFAALPIQTEKERRPSM